MFVLSIEDIIFLLELVLIPDGMQVNFFIFYGNLLNNFWMPLSIILTLFEKLSRTSTSRLRLKKYSEKLFQAVNKYTTKRIQKTTPNNRIKNIQKSSRFGLFKKIDYTSFQLTNITWS